MVDESNEFSVPTLTVPPRVCDAPTGSQFAQKVMALRGELRAQAVLEQVMLGNIPQFMKTLCPIVIGGMNLGGVLRTATLWVSPDYLCIGTDEDYVRFPLDPLTATKIADALGAFLPTRRIVNAIFEHAAVKLLARPKVAGNMMRSTQYVLDHNATIQEQLKDQPLGALVAGHKKDVVLCKALFDGHHDNRVAIYGWAQSFEGNTWKVWQGLNPKSHDNKYEDYSHGVRLVAGTIMVAGDPMSYDEALCDTGTAGLLSDEGALKAARYPGT